MEIIFSQEAAPIIGVLGLVLSLLGFALTAWGLWKTYQQAKDAEDAATAAADALAGVQFRIENYSAYRDVNEALIGMETCRKHLQNEAWPHASEAYETALRAVVRLVQSDIDFGRKLGKNLQDLAAHMHAFCDQVDAAVAQKDSFPERSKVFQAIRENYKVLSATNVVLEKRVMS